MWLVKVQVAPEAVRLLKELIGALKRTASGGVGGFIEGYAWYLTLLASEMYV